MEFKLAINLIGEEPVFESGLLLAGNTRPEKIRLQLSRWVKSGRIHQLRRGLYALAPPFQKVKPHPFLAANRMVRGSYVSLQSALGYCGVIPEYVHEITSVTTGRPDVIENELGRFSYRHIQKDWFCAYRAIEPGPIFIATPEKALLDLVALTPEGDDPAYIAELRLQNLAQLDADQLSHLALRNGKPKMLRALKIILQRMETEKMEENQ